MWSREVVKLKYFSLWRDSSLCCASFRMTRFCFLLTIRNLNYFKRKDFKLKTMLLREQSGNSLANWWSVCFKMFFSNGFICGVASTGSATVYENYFYAQPPSMKIIFMLFCFIFWSVKVLFFHYFFKYAKLAKFIRYEALWELLFKQTFFYHKVHGEQVKW